MAEHADGPVRPSSGAYIQHLVLRVRDLEASHDFYGSSVSSSAPSSSETSTRTTRCASTVAARSVTTIWRSQN